MKKRDATFDKLREISDWFHTKLPKTSQIVHIFQKPNKRVWNVTFDGFVLLLKHFVFVLKWFFKNKKELIGKC